ncbi:MAG: hypothetical protein JXA57_17100 [Armatimonadetes bacterium]|nr:hypothetical protein [Armatimonadota bacterium]
MRDVRGARIIADEDGRILEVHVVAAPGRQAKQIARDVESMIVARLGLPIDHRTISVAQTDAQIPQEGPSQAPEEEAEEPQRGQQIPGGYLANEDRRIRFVGVSVAQTDVMCEARVQLARDGTESAAAIQGPDCVSSVLRLVAEATLDATHRFFEEGSLFAVSSVEQVTVGGKPVVIVNVVHLAGREQKQLVGACAVTGDAQQAAALATLDAVNRFLRRLPPREPTEFEIGPASEG